MTGIVAGVLVALALAGCGDDDGGGDGDAAGGPFGDSGQGGDASGLGDDAGTVALPTSAEELVETLYGALAVNDVATACAPAPGGGGSTVRGRNMPPPCARPGDPSSVRRTESG